MGINSKHAQRLTTRLDRLDAATQPADMRLPGYDFHKLNPKSAGRYSVHVNGPWCITFEFEGSNATNVDYEQYH
ncbi:type II toxin-antitoxin system RelE/ParE family toxin [Endozoicomonas sp. 4G]|uniref:type II toxin-antitoxin system RelE/ParE family toxin n=1 Tax=Endozoicomonas sp. 4G TaxID=2872754 RepID=UPI002078CEE7|nr:type II toxin-antitoxin system RelE/ParE family toxin [Endozoicomonas sp. 4G]